MSSGWKVEHDAEAGAVYVSVRDASTIHRTHHLADDLMVDRDAKGRIVGVEILLPKRLPPSEGDYGA